MAENYKNESMVDVAHSVLLEKGSQLPFAELYNEVANKLELTEKEKDERISSFYTNLSIDGRFVILGNNEWDLRVNQTYDKVHIDMNDVYSDIDEEVDVDIEEEEEEEIDMEKEYGDDDSSMNDDNY